MKLDSDLRSFFKQKKIGQDKSPKAVKLRRKLLLSALRKDYPEKKATELYNKRLQLDTYYQM